MGRPVPTGLRLDLLAQARHHLSAFNAQELANTLWALSATSPPPSLPTITAGPAVAGPAAAGPSGALSPAWVEAWCTSAQPRLHEVRSKEEGGVCADCREGKGGVCAEEVGGEGLQLG